MKKGIFIVDSAGNTRDFHTFRPIVVDYPGKDMRDSLISFMLANSIKVMIFDYPDCELSIRFRACERLYPFVFTIHPYAAKS